jgi:hypothetical protein
MVMAACRALLFGQDVEFMKSMQTSPTWPITEDDILFKGSQTDRKPTHSALTSALYGDQDDYLSSAKKYFESQLTTSFKKSSGFYTTDWQRISLFGSDTLKLYFFCSKDGDHFNLNFLCEIHEKGFVDMSKWKYQSALKSLMSNQIREYYLVAYDELISKAQKNYDRQLKDLSKVEKKIEGYQKEKAKKLKDADKALAKMDNAKAKAAEAESKRKSITSEVNLTNKELEHYQSEKKMVQEDIALKEADKLRYHSGSESDFKRIEKLNKQIEKLKEEELKWLDKETSKKNEISKLESKMLDAERVKMNSQNSLNSLQLDVDNARRDAAKMDSLTEAARKSSEEENLQAEQALILLNALKLARLQVASR